ncbi:hypothetical protein [Solicola gregarius]|uniref:Lipoprotein n=1 Tax=Solicola gregarius TaxID=2908642 RepID=A0AA46YLW2_9ACTN|nr:hypothetical protein [Solicola gregarius]UYM05248.1 hypothetical protein L0C25_22480 [Solicola gregarius]
MKRLVAASVAAAICLSALAGCADAGDRANDPPAPAAKGPETTGPESDGRSGHDSNDKAGESGDDSGRTDERDGSPPDSGPGQGSDGRDDGAHSADETTGSRAYCDAVDDLRTEFDLSGVHVRDGADIEAAARAVRRVTDVAPDEVAPHWRRLAELFERVRSVLRRYDIDLSDAQALEDLGQQAYTYLLRAVRGYKSPDVVAAAEAIAADVRRSCGFSLR